MVHKINNGRKSVSSKNWFYHKSLRRTETCSLRQVPQHTSENRGIKHFRTSCYWRIINFCALIATLLHVFDYFPRKSHPVVLFNSLHKNCMATLDLIKLHSRIDTILKKRIIPNIFLFRCLLLFKVKALILRNFRFFLPHFEASFLYRIFMTFA